jgi:hypothetical protein
MWSIPWTSQSRLTDRIRVITDMLQRHNLVFGAIARGMQNREISGSRPQMRELPSPTLAWAVASVRYSLPGRFARRPEFITPRWSARDYSADLQ